VNDGVLLRLRPGTPRDEAEAEAFIRARGFDVNDADNVTSGIERTIRIETIALIVLGLVVAAVGVVVVGQMLRRQSAAERDEGLTIAALGGNRGDDLRLGLLRGSVLGVAGAGLGVVVAIAMSPIFPVGNGRIADPDVGLHADAVVLGVGAALTVAVVTVLGLGAAAAAVREGRRSRSRAGETTRPWPMPATRPPMVVGLYFALPARSRQRGSPARASLLSLAIVVIVLAATAVTLASYDHLVERRDLAGATWHAVIVPPPGENGTVDMEASLATVRAVPGVDAATSGMWATTGEGPIPGIYVDGRMVGVQLFGDEGPIRPAISHGRAPAAQGEVALGEKTLAALGVGIGDEVALSLEPDGKSMRGRIVGEVVLASPGSFDFAPGTGAATVTSTLAALGAEEYPESTILVSYEDGADPLRTFNAVEDALLTYEAYEAADRQSVSGLGRIRLVPLLLLLGLFGLVAAAVAHVLLVSVAGYRRDVAVLRAMGFTKGQSRSSIAVHASLLALAACVIGIPLGVILGRIAWQAIAANLYVVPRPMAPLALLALLTAALVVVANLASCVPAARAVRLRPATVLRSA
jgi:ABC-type lipoprotein release transport system permease subunit